MAISGSFDATVTRDNLITDAMLHIGALAEGATAPANAITEGARVLNMIVKLRHADGMPAWAMRRGTILPVTDVSSINTDSHVVTVYDATTLSANAASAASSVVVTAIGNIANADQIGIELGNGNMQWTTVNGAPSGTTVTLTSTLTAAASSGARIYAYTASADRIQKPIRIVESNIYNVQDSNYHPIKVTSRSEYYNLGNKSTDGTPNQMYYDVSPSTITALDTNGTIYFNPRFTGGDNVIEFTYQRPFQDFDAATDNPDFPQAFQLPLMLELSALLGPKYGVSIQERQALFKEAQFYLEKALETVTEEGSFYIEPEIW